MLFLAIACLTVFYASSPPVYPLAGATEHHYLCLGYRYDGGIVDKVIFLFADGTLSQIEARGGAVVAFAPLRSPFRRFFHLVVYDEGERFASVRDDTVWYLSPAAKQASLLFWSNPYLGDRPGQPKYDQSARAPQELEFGAAMGQLLPGLKQACPLLKVNKEGTGTSSQELANRSQIDCYGYEFAGFPRKLEVVFDDNRLRLARILVGQPESPRLFVALTAEHGLPTSRTETEVVFGDGQVALQQGPAVVLLQPKRVSLHP